MKKQRRKKRVRLVSYVSPVTKRALDRAMKELGVSMSALVSLALNDRKSPLKEGS